MIETIVRFSEIVGIGYSPIKLGDAMYELDEFVELDENGETIDEVKE